MLASSTREPTLARSPTPAIHLGHDYFCKRKPKEDSAKSLGVQPAGAVKEDEEAGCMDDKKIDYLLE
jgi:hypothetical protein